MSTPATRAKPAAEGHVSLRGPERPAAGSAPGSEIRRNCVEVSIVVIGLDEGERLPRALASAVAAAREVAGGAEVIYVDSGSKDGSPERAAAFEGVQVVRMTVRGASRARNEGIRRARGEFVQLLDGDMEIVPGWLPEAVASLGATGATAVAGRLIERHPEHSVWNLVMGMDWPSVAGPVETVGGAALWRRVALVRAGGFDEALRVGEDPDLCLRLRRGGAAFAALARPMATHDLDLRSFRAYLRRAAASGESRANVASRHPDSGHARSRLREPLRHVAVSVAVAGAAAFLGPVVAAAAGAAAGAVVARRALRSRRDGAAWRAAALHAIHAYAVKIPVAWGVLRGLAAQPATRASEAAGPVRPLTSARVPGAVR